MLAIHILQFLLAAVALWVIYYVVVYFSVLLIGVARAQSDEAETLHGAMMQSLVVLFVVVGVPIGLMQFANISQSEAVVVGLIMWPIASQGWWVLGGAVIAAVFGFNY